MKMFQSMVLSVVLCLLAFNVVLGYEGALKDALLRKDESDLVDKLLARLLAIEETKRTSMCESPTCYGNACYFEFSDEKMGYVEYSERTEKFKVFFENGDAERLLNHIDSDVSPPDLVASLPYVSNIFEMDGANYRVRVSGVTPAQEGGTLAVSSFCIETA